MKRSDIIFGIARVPLDFGLLLLAAFAAYAVRTSDFVASIRPIEFEEVYANFVDLLPLAGIAALVIMASLAATGLYALRIRMSLPRELATIALAITVGVTFIIVFLFFRLTPFDSRFILVVGWLFAILFVSLGRWGLHIFREFLLYVFGVGRNNVMLIGSGEEMNTAKHHILSQGGRSFALVGELPGPHRELVERIHRMRPLHRIVMVNSYQERDEILRIINFCEENNIQFSYVPDLFGSLLAEMDFDVMNGMAVVSIRPTPLDGWWRVMKRLLDIAGALAALIIFSPLMLVAALAIKRHDGGPVLVKLRRVSQGKEFNLYKFRSMVVGAHEMKDLLAAHNERFDGPLFKMKNDPRITPLGRLLRAHRLDEFPQLFNVLKGEMSLVGPRPHEPEEVARYQDQHRKVFAVKAGITGFAQVNGAQDLPFEEEVKLDRYYIEHWSLKMDIMALVRTVWIFIFDDSGV